MSKEIFVGFASFRNGDKDVVTAQTKVAENAKEALALALSIVGKGDPVHRCVVGWNLEEGMRIVADINYDCSLSMKDSYFCKGQAGYVKESMQKAIKAAL